MRRGRSLALVLLLASATVAAQPAPGAFEFRLVLPADALYHTWVRLALDGEGHFHAETTQEPRELVNPDTDACLTQVPGLDACKGIVAQAAGSSLDVPFGITRGMIGLAAGFDPDSFWNWATTSIIFNEDGESLWFRCEWVGPGGTGASPDLVIGGRCFGGGGASVSIGETANVYGDQSKSNVGALLHYVHTQIPPVA